MANRPMTKPVTDWKVEGELPDEEHLKALWKAEMEIDQARHAAGLEQAKFRRASLEPLIKASGIEIETAREKARTHRKSHLGKIDKELGAPRIDIEALHKQHRELAMADFERRKDSPTGEQKTFVVPGTVVAEGIIDNASSGGSWWSRNGESEEDPVAGVNYAIQHLDPRAQAYGEWLDKDWSKVHAYLTFTFRPPKWGTLGVNATPWFHGYWSEEDSHWWDWGSGTASASGWIDVHQNSWRGRQYFPIWQLAARRSGRVDTSLYQHYQTNVSARDRVTIRVGVYLRASAEGAGSHAKVNFRKGTGNYIDIPWISWTISQ